MNFLTKIELFNQHWTFLKPNLTFLIKLGVLSFWPPFLSTKSIVLTKLLSKFSRFLEFIYLWFEYPVKVHDNDEGQRYQIPEDKKGTGAYFVPQNFDFLIIFFYFLDTIFMIDNFSAIKSSQKSNLTRFWLDFLDFFAKKIKSSEKRDKCKIKLWQSRSRICWKL